MTTPSNFQKNGIYFLDPNLTSQQINNAISRCLCKADALASLLAIVDLKSIDIEIIYDYLWALRDIIYEGKWLQKITTDD